MMPLRRGTHLPLEEVANAMLKESLKNVTRHADKSDLLTPWKEQERRRREVYVPSGTPDAANRSGLFYRAINTTHAHLNSRGSTTTRARRVPIMTINDDSSSFGSGAVASYNPAWDKE